MNAVEQAMQFNGITPAMEQQVRDAVGRLTWGYQSAATVLAAGVHVNALRAALVQLGRDADAEIKAAIGAKE